jgi:nitrite reductase (NADH) large subunit
MRRAAVRGGRAIVIGGGLLGLEAAAGLKRQGMDVTVIHLMPTLMERQLDPAAGELLAQTLRGRGIDVVTAANTKQILGDDHVTGLELADGRVLPADLVVMAVGIRPSTSLAKEAGLTVNRGIVADAQMRTSDPAIFALGECAEVDGQCFGLVAPLYDMANVVAAQLAGRTDARFTAAATATRLKVTGINLYSAGDFASGDDREEIVLRDDGAGIYKRVVLRDDKIIGTVLYGDTADGPWFFDLLTDQTAAGAIRDTLIFGRAYDTAAPLDPYGGRCSVAG